MFDTDGDGGLNDEEYAFFCVSLLKAFTAENHMEPLELDKDSEEIAARESQSPRVQKIVMYYASNMTS